MRILVKEGETVISDLSFVEEEEITVGSQSDCTIHLPDARISPQNLLLSPTEEGAWLIENLDPDNRVLLNNHVLRDRITLRDDDEIVVHDFRLRVYLTSIAQEPVVEELQLSAEDLVKIKQFPLPPGTLMRLHKEQVNLSRGQLDRLAQVSLPIAAMRDIHDWVDSTLNLLLDLFDARSAWVGIRRQPRGELDIQGGKLSNGQSCSRTPVIDQTEYRCVERGQHLCVRKVRDHEFIGSAMAIPLMARGGALGMAYVDRRTKSERFRSIDLDLFSAVGAHLSRKLEAMFVGQAQRSAELSATEISVVHAIQAHLDPKTAPSFEQLQLAAYSRSGQENPGDVYDVMRHPDTGITALMLGHVNATGALLALSMARLHSTFRVGFLHNDPPHALARALNWLMYDERDPSTVDAIFVAIHPASGKMKYARAGKVGAFIVNNQGQPRALQGADGPPIGQVRNFEYVSHLEKLAPGETLAIYSRGTASCTNGEGQRFGEHRFIDLVCDGFGQHPSTTLQEVSDELTNFFAEGRHPDDISTVLLHRLEE